MEHFNIDPITTGEELFRLLFPSILEQTPCSDTNAVIGLISDACYALLLYKAVPGAAPEARSAQKAALETFLHGHGIHCFRFHGHHMGIIPYHTWDLAVVPQKTEILEHRIGIYLSKALRDSGVELNLSIGRPFQGLLNLRDPYSELINSTMTFSLRPDHLVVSEYDIVNNPALMGDPYPRSEIERQLADAIIHLEIRKAEELMENIIQYELSTLRLKLSFLPRMGHSYRMDSDCSARSTQFRRPQKRRNIQLSSANQIRREYCGRDCPDPQIFPGSGRLLQRLPVQRRQGHFPDHRIYPYAAGNPALCATMICDRFRISPSYLSHMFKRRTGIKLVDYIHKTRIDLAKRLLETTTKTIAEISREVGYISSTSFSTTFKRYESITPREYRDRFLLGR